jgi:predicted aldo/keto reductase-like oxidoreductase
VNPAEPVNRSFLDDLFPLANKKGIGVVGMKVYLKGMVKNLPMFTSFEPYFRFALSHPLSTAVIGCDNIEQLEENIKFAQSFKSMTKKEMERLIDEIFRYSDQLMYYKV